MHFWWNLVTCTYTYVCNKTLFVKSVLILDWFSTFIACRSHVCDIFNVNFFFAVRHWWLCKTFWHSCSLFHKHFIFIVIFNGKEIYFISSNTQDMYNFKLFLVISLIIIFWQIYDTYFVSFYNKTSYPCLLISNKKSTCFIFSPQ